LESQDGEEENEGRDGEEQDRDSEGEPSVFTQFNKKWGWFSCVDNVSQTLRTDWETVFSKNIVEFLNILSYAKDKAELEKWQMKEYQNKMKNRRSY
jgi:hypothetical protein